MIPYAKSSDEVRAYTYDWTDHLNTASIETSAWAADAGIAIDSSTHTSRSATVVVSGGTGNETYLLTNTIVADNGQTYQGAILARIVPVDRDSLLRRARLRADKQQNLVNVRWENLRYKQRKVELPDGG
jgi:hypothetical protein